MRYAVSIVGACAIGVLGCSSSAPTTDGGDATVQDVGLSETIDTGAGEAGQESLCRCPSSIGIVPVPAELATIRDVSADSCSVEYDSATRTIRAHASMATTCHVEISRENGATSVATLVFKAGESCCASLFLIESAQFESPDGGVDAADGATSSD